MGQRMTTVATFMTGGSDIIGPQAKILSNTMNPFALGSSHAIKLSCKFNGLRLIWWFDGDMWKGRAISLLSINEAFNLVARGGLFVIRGRCN